MKNNPVLVQALKDILYSFDANARRTAAKALHAIGELPDAFKSEVT